MKRTGEAVWRGDLRDGKGTLTTQSQVLEAEPFSFSSRFGDQLGTNPEELIAAAHAGCYSMTLALLLDKANLRPERIGTTVALTLEFQEPYWNVTAVHLDARARAPGAEDAQFQELADQAKRGCLVSRLLNAPITLSAALES